MLFVSGVSNTFPVFFPPLLAEFGGSRAGPALSGTAVWVARRAEVLIALLPLAWHYYPARLEVHGAATPAAGGGMGDLLRTAPFWALATLFSLAPFIGNLATMQHAVYFATLGYPAWEASL